MTAMTGKQLMQILQQRGADIDEVSKQRDGTYIVRKHKVYYYPNGKPKDKLLAAHIEEILPESYVINTWKENDLILHERLRRCDLAVKVRLRRSIKTKEE